MTKTAISTTLIAALCLTLSGCAQNRSTHQDSASSQLEVDGDAYSEDTSANLDEEGLEESRLLGHRRKKTHDAQLEQTPTQSAESQAVKKSPAEEVQAMLPLARFYRVHHRPADSLKTLEQAYAAAQPLGANETEKRLKGLVCVQLGDAVMRFNRTDQALKLFKEAVTLVPPYSDSGENRLHVLPRIAWAYRQTGDVKNALSAAKQATDEANAVLGTTAPLYRVGLTEQAVLALDRGDTKAFGKFKMELDSLGTRETAPFARGFLRSCARQCRKDQQLEQAKFLDTQAKYFAARK